MWVSRRSGCLGLHPITGDSDTEWTPGLGYPRCGRLPVTRGVSPWSAANRRDEVPAASSRRRNERDLVYVTPTPFLARLGRAHDRVAGLGGRGAGMGRRG